MAQIDPTREWLLRYVLGELSEDETRLADEEFFAEDELSALVDEKYRDLMDTYAAGELTGSEKERVERAFFSGNNQVQGRQRKISQAMQAMPAMPTTEPMLKKAAVTVEPKKVGRPWFLGFWPVAATATLLSFAVGIFIEQHSETLQKIAQRSAPVNVTIPAVEQHAPAIAAPPSTEKLYTVLLLPEVTRGDDAAKTFAIPASTDAIVFQVVLPRSQTTGAAMEARLTGTHERAPQVFPGLAPRTIDTDKYVEFRVDAAALVADDYAVKVFDGPTATKAVEHFLIHVTRKN